MILFPERIIPWVRLGQSISWNLEKYNSDPDNELFNTINNATAENPWFTKENILIALRNWVIALEQKNVEKWAMKYKNCFKATDELLNIAVINAGNIPLSGLLDFISVLFCGFNYIGKNATGDSVLLPYISSLLCSIEPAFNDQIHFVSKLETMDAVIATGNNNSSRYFEYYFGKYPHIIRKNRNGVGVLNGNESANQLHSLGKDIFTYFGLGCRNVSKIYVPAGYNFNKLFEAFEDFKDLRMHNKYMNNFDYNNSVFLLKKIPFLQNGFLIVRNENQIASPVSVLHYEEYNSPHDLLKSLENSINQLQCIVAEENIFTENKKLENIKIGFGKTQSPLLWDYADGVDTVEFLCRL